jgi:hypothetical protein
MKSESHILIGQCPHCLTISRSVNKYGLRKLKHFELGLTAVQTLPFTEFRCLNDMCPHKTFRQYAPDIVSELDGKNRYTKSTKNFVVKKLLKYNISYSSFSEQIKDDFQARTSVSTLYGWAKKAKVLPANTDLSDVTILHTDEKYPQKKRLRE